MIDLKRKSISLFSDLKISGSDVKFIHYDELEENKALLAECILNDTK
jgi:hypothetical protein